MGSLSDYAENKLLDHVFNAAYTPAAAVYIGLSTADPTDDGSGTAEPVGNNYARQEIAFSAASGRKVVQDGDVTFDAASGPWGTITHWAIFDALNAGNMLAHGVFTSSFAPVSGNSPIVATTQVQIEIAATSGGAGFTTSCVHKMLDLMFRNTAWAAPAGNTFIALASAALDDADAATVADMTEQSGTDYVRVEVNPSTGAAPKWAAASGGALSNADVITMIASGSWTTDDWSQIVSMAVVSLVSGDAEIYCYDNDNIVDQTPGTGDTVQFAAGALDISLS